MKACPLVSQASSWPCVSLRRAFCTASSTEAVECMMLAHLRLLPGSIGSTASFLDCLAAALQDLLRRHTPPQGLQMSRRGTLGAARVLCNGFSTASDACRSLRGIWFCVLSVDTRASLLVERSTVMRIATMMISYRVQCSDEYDNLAQDHIRHKSAAKQPSQDR